MGRAPVNDQSFLVHPSECYDLTAISGATPEFSPTHAKAWQYAQALAAKSSKVSLPSGGPLMSNVLRASILRLDAGLLKSFCWSLGFLTSRALPQLIASVHCVKA